MIIAKNNVWRAELTIGTKLGYEGPEVVTPGDVIGLVQTFFKETTEETYATIVWTRGTVMGPGFDPETVIKVTIENNPLYSSDAKDSDVQAYAVRLSAFLAAKLQQQRIYVAMFPIVSLIHENK